MGLLYLLPTRQSSLFLCILVSFGLFLCLLFLLFLFAFFPHPVSLFICFFSSYIYLFIVLHFLHSLCCFCSFCSFCLPFSVSSCHGITSCLTLLFLMPALNMSLTANPRMDRRPGPVNFPWSQDNATLCRQEATGYIRRSSVLRRLEHGDEAGAKISKRHTDRRNAQNHE